MDLGRKYGRECGAVGRALARIGAAGMMLWGSVVLAAGVPLHNGLITSWTFDSASGTTLPDGAPTGAVSDTGTLRNSPTWLAGKFGNALRFNGTNQDVLVPNSADMNIGTNAVTLSAWVKLEQLPTAISGSFSGIFDSEGDNYVMYLDKTNNELRFKVTTSNNIAERPGVPGNLLDTTNWHHIMGVYDGALGEARMYFDGQLADVHGNGSLTANVKTGQTAGLGAQVTAASPFTASSFFKGSIDDFGVWNRALGLAEAQYLYNSGIGNSILAANPTLEPVVPPTPHNRSIYVEGHRGNAVAAPENTFASVAAAAGYADYVELDVQVTADNRLIIMHDSTLDRTTNGTGAINSKNYTGYIDGLEAGSWFSPAFASEKVPLMQPYVQSIRDHGMKTLMERKSGSATAILGELAAINALDDTVIICFDWDFLAQVRALNPTIKLGALGSGAITSTVINNVLASGSNFLDWSDDGSITQATVNMVHAAGLELHAWTVDSLARMQQLIDLGVDGITTNAPETLRTIVPLPGDFNYDGAVNAADYIVWRDTLGDAQNYATWRANFGRLVPGSASGAALAAPVPEPAAAVVMFIGLIFVAGRQPRVSDSRSHS
ncbi:MAG: glycerophosphodiester phosphodiesterase family protein [Pirellulales bacterium]